MHRLKTFLRGGGQGQPKRRLLAVIAQILLFVLAGWLYVMHTPAPSAKAQTSVGITYRLAYNATSGRYEVYMRPNAAVSAPMQTLSAQVTLKVPHVTGSNAFVIANVASHVGSTWAADVPVRAPSEDPSADYLSVQLQGPTNALTWQTNQEILVFSFQNSGACAGPISLLLNNDPFNTLPNSTGSNPANQIDVLTFGNDPGNDYIGNYGTAAVNCAGIEYRVAYNATSGRYEVYMRPIATAGAPMQTLSAQVTLKVPHVAGSNAFTIANLTSYPGTTWAADVPVRAPSEDTSADYLSVQLQGPTNALTWQTNQELLVFSFQNSGTCSGPVSLLLNNDPFNTLPNSVGSNPANQIDVLTFGNDPGNDYIGNYGTAAASCAGIEYRVAYNATSGRYEVYMRPTATAGAPMQTLSAQVTLKVPHVTGSNAFVIANLTSHVGTTWAADIPVRAPSEDPSADYLSVQLQGPTNALTWQTNQELLVFSFQNSGACTGPASLLLDTDPFNTLPNSAGSNPANQIDVLTFGNDPGNDYIGNYGSLNAFCGLAPDLTTTIGQPVPSLVAGVASNVPLTVTNAITAGPTTGVITGTMTLPTGTSAPASFANGPWSCTTVSQTVTCTQPGPLAPGASSTVQVPVTPNASTVGTMPGPFTGTSSTPGETNTANNPATPMTPTVPVAGVPDLTTSIGQPAPNFKAGVASNVPLTVTNLGTSPTTGVITTTLTLPSGTSAPASFANGPWSCTTVSQTVTCTQPGPLAPGASSTVQVPVTPNASTVGTMPGPFTGTSSTPGETNTANNPATPMTPTVPVAGVPDLTTTIGQPAPSLVAGVASNVPLTVTNLGTSPTTGVVTTTLTLPSGTSAPASFTSGPWNCTTVSQTVTCTQPGPIAAGSSSTVQVPVTPNASTVGTMPGPFTGTSSTPGETNTANNPATPMTPTVPVAGVPDLTTTIGQPAPSLMAGVASSVPITVANLGTSPTTGVVTTTLTLPSGTSAPASFTSGPWNCTTVSQTVTCTQPGPIAAGSSSTVQVPVTPNASTVGTMPGPFTGTSSTPGETNTANNPATPMTPTVPVAGVPDLTTTIGQPAPSLVAGVASNVPLTVTNLGTSPTTGVITTTLTLPSGTSAPASFTSGPWSCTTVSQTVTCTQPGPIAPGASSTVQVPVTPNASTVGTMPGPFTGTSSTPGETVTANNPATPMTPTVPVAGVPDLTTTIGQPAPSLVAGVASSVPITVANLGTSPTTGVVTTTLTLPSGTSAPASFTSGPWNCTTVSQTVTCTQPGPLAPGASSTVQVPVTPNASTVGTMPGPFTGTSSTPGETVTANNPATPMTPTVPVASAIAPILPIKVFLGGAYNTSVGLMRDDLRRLNLLPITEPYSSISSFTHMNGGGGETINPSVFSVTGNNAIVDWVFVELRNAASPTIVVATRAALIQRDGDVVGVDGINPLTLPPSYNNQNYYVVVRHRNHLGVMTASPVTLTTTTAPVDFTSPATPVYGTNAQNLVGSVNTLWSGNTNANRTIINAGPNNDVNPILLIVLGDPNNGVFNRNYVVNGYKLSDVTMDGRTIAAGPNNDVNPILINIFVHPNNTTLASNYIIQEQVP